MMQVARLGSSARIFMPCLLRLHTLLLSSIPGLLLLLLLAARRHMHSLLGTLAQDCGRQLRMAQGKDQARQYVLAELPVKGAC